VMVIGIVSSPATGIPDQLSTTLLPMPHHYILWLPQEISLSHLQEREPYRRVFFHNLIAKDFAGQGRKIVPHRFCRPLP
jgi:hypothetical protein